MHANVCIFFCKIFAKLLKCVGICDIVVLQGISYGIWTCNPL